MNLEYPFSDPSPKILTNPSYDEKLKKMSLKNLLIVSDFDFTLTKRFEINKNTNKREQLLCGFWFYDICPLLPSSFLKAVQDIKDKYTKYEDDLSLPLKTRYDMTEKLFTEVLDLLIGLKSIKKKNFLEETIEETMKLKPFYYRKGVNKYLDILRENNIPEIFISGGITEAITTTLKMLNEKVNLDNIKVISNEFIYDENEIAIDYVKPIVFTFNKSEMVDKKIKSFFSLEELKEKDILFTGDHINDIDAIKDIECRNKLSIAFDNNVTDKNMNEEYLKKYDAVVCNDGDFNFVVDTLKKIIENSK